MDDAWHAKCSSAWPPASSSVPPPPEFPAPSPGSVNQMGMNSRNFSHSFAQEMNLGDSATVQESMVFNTLNLDSCKSGRAELTNNFFLSLLSGHSHHVSSDILQLPCSRSPLAKPQVCHSGIVHGVSFGVPTTGIPPLSENRGNDDMGNGEFSQFVASRPLTTFTCAKTPLLHNDFQTASHCHGPNSRKPAPHQAFQGNSAGTEVSARRHGCPTASISLKANQQHILSQTSQKMPLEAKPSISCHSSNFRGRPRVFCMNKVGELFVSDMGLLGVLCFCHKMPMSVTKFCEHSGSPSGDPGEAVHLENGMTVAQWRMLCSGVMASDHDGGWDWSDGSEGGLVRSKFSNFPTSSQNPAPINSNKAFGRLGRFEEPPNQFVSANHTYNGLGGKTASEKSANKDADNAHQRNGLMRYDRYAKSFASSIQTPVSVLAKNHTVQVVKESPVCISFQGAHSTLNKGKQNARPQFVSNNANYMGEIGNLPISFPRSGMRKTSSFNHDISKGNFPSEAFVVDQDGTSNIELRLGHPSQNNHLPVSSFPKAMHPLQFGAMCNLQNPQLHQPLTHRTDYPKEAKRPTSNSQRTPSEVASFNRRKFQHSVGSNSFKSSESEDLMCDATKNSLISFLSHLNTEGNKPSKSTDDIGNYNDYHMTRVLDIDSLYAKCNLSDFMRETTDGIERKSNTNRSDVPNNIEQGKELRVSDNDSYSMLKSNYLVHNKQTPDTRVLASGRCVHSSSVDDEHSKLNFNQPSGMLNTVSDARTSNQCVEVSFLGNRDHNAHAIHRSTRPVSNGTTRPGSLNSETPMTLSLTNSIYMSEQASASSNKKKTDRHNNLSSLRSLAELSKPEQSSSSLEASHQRRRLCCLSDVESQKNDCQNDLMAPEELREGPCCIIQQDASKIAVRSSHSFSNCCSDGDIQMLAVKHGNTGPYKCCNCTTSPQRISLRSKEHDIQFSTGRICRAQEQPCLRLGQISKNNYSDSVKFGMCNQREESPSSSGKCCCTILPKYLTGCCFSGGDNVTSALNGHVCGKARIMHVNPACDNDHMLQDGKRIRQGQCECLRKHVVMKNDWQIAHWRDVPNKVIGHSGPTSNEKPAQMLPAMSSLGDHTMTVANDLHRTQQGSESMKEQQMSNVCSGFSTPAITDVSIEVNNAVSFVTDAENAKIIHDFVVDEGSRIEKCGSSDEALDTRESEEAIIFKDKVNPTKSGLHCLPSSSSGDLMDEHRSKSSSNLKRLRNQITSRCTGEENISQKRQFERPGKAEKQKGPTKCSILDASVQQLGVSSLYSESSRHVGRLLHHSSSKEIEPPPQPDNLMQKTCILSGRSLSVKRKRSTLSSAKAFSIKGLVNNHKEGECSKSLSTNDDHSLKAQKASVGKKAKEELTMIVKQNDTHVATGKPPKYISLSCIGNSPIYGMDTSCKKVRPVVSGNSGIISSGLSDQNKPAKIVPLSLILKKASRCSITVNEGKPRPAFISKTRLNANGGCCKALSSSKVQHENADSCDVIRYGVDSSIPVSDCEINKKLKSGFRHEYPISRSKPRCEETRKFGIKLGIDKHATKRLSGSRESECSNLTEAGNQLKTPHPSSTDIDDSFGGNKHLTLNLCSRKILKSALLADTSLVNRSKNDQDHLGELCEENTRSSKENNCQSSLLDSDVFCCVCGSSNQEVVNRLLECNRCLIRVHQACYGVSKIPKGHWHCRPCKANSLNIVCVLCGYGDGAMTRAVKSRNIVRSLLNAWKVRIGSDLINSAPSSKNLENELLKPSSVSDAAECDSLVSVVESIASESFPRAVSKMDIQITSSTQYSDCLANDFQACNSITVGILDPSITQWVHMVCGLWTPGTRCPNVDTMSTFDVSGASPSRKNNVCSMCNRPGGSCIQCRVLNCSIHFHPWCAHQKGLLQSEIEGDDNEKVGFYGRCMLHATNNNSHINPVDAEVENPRNRDWTCARTEGFKGRKRDEGLKPEHQKPYNDGGGCIVSQEQINAWLHINGQKSCTRVVVKLPYSDMEYDIRKEYIRYKQSKGWKQLVVYKSGIHALGLYTSQFIIRGAMVVEYVGEIVGLRVADKRELEYQSGRRLQYKSACYFFRIDKEHIIDATRKGGIARFVNHSCLPNSVAKIISVRNEKKVVFFAERDIYPGEEITYDYHFNHEDEGKKIPCFCKSKNCRRYLN